MIEKVVQRSLLSGLTDLRTRIGEKISTVVEGDGINKRVLHHNLHFNMRM
jgi:hypothetical protein